MIPDVFAVLFFCGSVGLAAAVIVWALLFAHGGVR